MVLGTKLRYAYNIANIERDRRTDKASGYKFEFNRNPSKV